MNGEIKALIEREDIERRLDIAEKGIAYFNKKKGIHNVIGVDPAWLSVFNEAYEIGHTDALSLFRWRSFASDDLPKIGQVITVRNKTKKKYNTQEVQSYSHIHVLAENYLEWMPIPKDYETK